MTFDKLDAFEQKSVEGFDQIITWANSAQDKHRLCVIK